MRNFIIILIFNCISLFITGHIRAQDLGHTGLEITAKQQGSSYKFSVNNKPALQQIAGAPEAHYGYFWEFGNGQYSYEEEPVYAYRDSGEVKVNVALTNNYGSGGAPRIKSRRLKINTVPATPAKTKSVSSLDKKESIKVFTNHQPRPGDQMVCVVSYQNTELSGEAMRGRVYLFYNEKEFDYKNFVFEEARQHYGEKFYKGFPDSRFSFISQHFNEMYASLRNTPNTIPQFASPLMQEDPRVQTAKNMYGDVLTWDFDALHPGEVRNIFITLGSSSQMIKDTANTVSLRAVLLPEFPSPSKEYTHKMVVRSSHDPNELRVSDKNINKRTIRKRGITYTIKFQNVGKGSASTISIKQPIHSSLDPNTIEVLDYYPKSNFCLSSDSLATLSCLDTIRSAGQLMWQFQNIYLPGTRQSDKESRQATHGWITYRIKPYKKFRRQDVISNQASIIFDKNEPIKTNRARTHVRKNYGYNIRLGTFDITYGLNGISGAFGVSPFYAKKFYYQPEIGATFLEYEGRTTVQNGIVVGFDGNGDPLNGDRKIIQKYQSVYLDITPIQMRYNLTPFINVGAGFQIALLMKANEKTTTQLSYTTESFNVPPFPPKETETNNDAMDAFPDKTELNFFADVQGGLVRNGPSVGVRANYRTSNRPLDDRANNFFVQLYLQYKF